MLAACGGGAGVGGSDNPTPGSNATLSVSTQVLSFASRAPGVEAPTQTISAQIGNASQITGNLYITVTVTGPAVEDVGGVTITNSNSGSATVYPRSSRALGAGTHTSRLTVRACVDACGTGELRGSPQIIDVTYTIDQFKSRHNLVAVPNGVGFTSMPAASKLTRTVKVADSQGHAIAWSASADQPWVNVTAAGVTPGDLTITANPTGLTPNAMHYANVTLTPGESGIAQNEIVRVGFWVGTINPVNVDVAGPFEEAIADPIRPYVYVHNGDQSLFVHDVNSGQRIRTIAVGRTLGDMVVATDGSRLFAASASAATTPIDLTTYAVGTALPGNAQGEIEYARVDGAELIATNTGSFINTNSGAVFGSYDDPIRRYNETVAVSGDGHRLCTLNRGLSPNRLLCYRLNYSDVGGDVAVVDFVNETSVGSNGNDLVLSSDGSRVYAASGAPYNFSALDFGGTAIAYLTGNPYPNNIELGPDGKIFGGASSGIWIYNANETSFRQTSTSFDIRTDGLRVSGDGLRMIFVGNGGGLRIRNVAP
jgi:hypothetical protein